VTTENPHATKSAQPPAELATAINAALTSVAANETTERARLIAASRVVLARVLKGDCERRAGALDLLTFDALVTYAMETGATTAADCETTAAAILAVINEAAAS